MTGSQRTVWEGNVSGCGYSFGCKFANLLQQVPGLVTEAFEFRAWKGSEKYSAQGRGPLLPPHLLWLVVKLTASQTKGCGVPPPCRGGAGPPGWQLLLQDQSHHTWPAVGALMCCPCPSPSGLAWGSPLLPGHPRRVSSRPTVSRVWSGGPALASAPTKLSLVALTTSSVLEVTQGDRWATVLGAVDAHLGWMREGRKRGLAKTPPPSPSLKL